MESLSLIDSFMKLITNYGVMAVEIGIILIFAWQLMPIVLKWFDRRLNGDSVENSIKTDESIVEILKCLKLETGADRSYLFEFHNGTFTLSGAPIMKMSCMQEVVNAGVEPQQPLRQAMPLAPHMSLVKRIITDPFVTVDMRNITDDFDMVVYGTVEALGTIVKLSCKVVGKLGNIVGYLGLDYTIEDTLPTQEQIEKYGERMTLAARDIGRELSKKRKETK